MLRTILDLSHELYRIQGHNASLIDQLAYANKRIAVLEERLRGNNEMRRIASVTRIPQATVYKKLIAWIQSGCP